MDLHNIFETAFAKRRDLFTDAETDCFRLFNAAGDGHDGLCIDRYGAWLLVLIEKPGLLEQPALLFTAIEAAAKKLPQPVHGIVCKDISRADTGCIDEVYAGTVIAGAPPPADLIVRQNGCRASVDLMDGRHTGLFLDMRVIRKKLVPFFKPEGQMLNLFCYSGMFSVHGLKNGLAAALNLDLAKSALDRTRRNYELNNIPCHDRDFMYGDALTWMKAFAKKGRRFDVVVLDPPTFARGRKGLFSVKKDFPAALELAGKLAPGGVALTVINSPAYSERQYRQWHPAAWRLLWLEHEPADFPWQQRPYLKAGLWRLPA